VSSVKFAPRYLTFGMILVALLTCNCKENKTEEIKTERVSFTKEGELQVFKKDTLIVTLDVEFAETDYEVQTGLMYRSAMENHQGMLFIFSNSAMHSFYMKNTEFPLDILFLDENQKMVSFQKNAQPFNESSLSSKVPVKYVLEINAGLSDQWNLVEGDSITFNRIP